QPLQHLYPARVCAGALCNGFGHRLMQRHRRAPVRLDERHGYGGSVRPVGIGADTLRRDEATLLIHEAHAVNDPLGYHDLREHRRAGTAAAAGGLVNPKAKLTTGPEIELQDLQAAASRRVPAHQELGPAPHAKDERTWRIERSRYRHLTRGRIICVV